MAKTFKLTIFPRYNANEPGTEIEASWEELVTALTTFEPLASKEAGKLFSPATFGGKTRANQHAEAVHFGVLDFDGTKGSGLQPEENQHLLKCIETYGGAVVLTQTYRYNPEKPKYRLVVPFNRSVLPHEWRSVWLRLRALFGGLADPQRKDLAGFYYCPSHPPTPGYVPFSRVWEGTYLDVDNLLKTSLPVQELAEIELEPVSRQALERSVNGLQKTNPLQADTLRHVLAGQKWAVEGYRDSALYALCRELVRIHPTGDPVSLASHFEQSCSHWTDFTIVDVAEKLRRLQRDVQVDRALDLEHTRQARSALLEISSAGASDFHGVNTRALIIQHGSAYWVYAGKALGYKGPYTPSGTPNACQMWLTPAAGLVELYQPSGKLRDVQDLASDYMTQAASVVYDYYAEKGTWDVETQALTLAPCPLQPQEPTYHPQIDAWLKLAAGDEYETLCQWLAWATYDHPCVMLYISGPASTGKSLFAMGVGSLWGAAPAKLESVFSDFDTNRLKSPIYWGDEYMPKDRKGRVRTDELRVLIQETERDVRIKYQKDSLLRGACRVIVTANNLEELVSGNTQKLSADDHGAIEARIRHIRFGPEAAAFLADTDTSDWVTGGHFARHIIHLKQKYPFPEKPLRFLFPRQEVNAVVSTLLLTNYQTSAICHWLVAWLVDPRRNLKGELAKACFVENGEVYIQPSALLENWSQYSAERMPTAVGLGKELSTLSNRHKHQRRRTWYHVVPISRLQEWCEVSGFMEPEELEDLTEVIPAIPKEN